MEKSGIRESLIVGGGGVDGVEGGGVEGRGGRWRGRGGFVVRSWAKSDAGF